jgi:hypothetical protein
MQVTVNVPEQLAELAQARGVPVETMSKKFWRSEPPNSPPNKIPNPLAKPWNIF